MAYRYILAYHRGLSSAYKRSIEYTENVDDLFVRHGMCHHLSADDMQGFRSGHPSDISAIVTGVEDCLSDVSSWSADAAKRLQL